MPPAPPPFSFSIFGTLLLIFCASLTTFLMLVRRWTTQRQWVSLAEWARERRFKFKPAGDPLPQALARLAEHGAEARLNVCKDAISLLQLQTAGDTSGARRRWNVLVQKTPARRAAIAALRPVMATASIVDLMGLSEFPSLAVARRFTVLATTSAAGRALADSASRTLLPPDVGLLLVEDYLVLDFSTRPFDPIELDRMIALAKQVAQMM